MSTTIGDLSRMMKFEHATSPPKEIGAFVIIALIFRFNYVAKSMVWLTTSGSVDNFAANAAEIISDVASVPQNPCALLP